MSIIISQIQIKGNKEIIRLVKGDIAETDVDVIVNAANSYLKHGGRVADAIAGKGGSAIQNESNKIGFVPVGSSVITTAGRLPFRTVIHTAGPRMGEADEKQVQDDVNKLQVGEKKQIQTDVNKLQAGEKKQIQTDVNKLQSEYD